MTLESASTTGGPAQDGFGYEVLCVTVGREQKREKYRWMRSGLEDMYASVFGQTL
jgi:hypothetical protein